MTRIWENMVYLIFDKSANPTPTPARLDISVQLEKKNFLKGFYKFFKSSGRKRYFGLFSALDMSPKGGSGCRSWELKWSTRCPGSALPPRWKTLRSAGNITTVSVETRTLGAKTFVLDDSRFCGGRITICMRYHWYLGRARGWALPYVTGTMLGCCCSCSNWW